MSKDLQKEISTFHTGRPGLAGEDLVHRISAGDRLGPVVAGGQIMMTHGMADGKFGLSVDDIVYSYHGNREGEGGAKLVAKLNGSMKGNAPPDVRLAMIKWVENGASQQEWE